MRSKDQDNSGELIDRSVGVPGPEFRPQRSSQIVSRQIGEETILVPVKSTKSALEDIFTLNEVASRTWELIDGENTIAAIAAIIASEYEVPAEVAITDTLDLITQFSLAGAIMLPEP